MNPQEWLDRLRSPSGKLALTVIAVSTAGLLWALRSSRTAPDSPLYTNASPLAATSITREIYTPRSYQPPQNPKTAPVAPKPLAPLQIHVALPPETNPPPLAVFAPAGRLIRAVTVNSVDSANTDTPIIALVSDSVWFDGEEIIPAGTELHGRVSVDRLRDRIIASGPWTVVWQNGEELTVQGIALDRDDNDQGRWGERDGSAGLTGQVIRTDNAAEIKLFAATFLSGASGAFQQTQNTLFGNQVLGTTRNAAIAGGSQVLNTYAQQIAETIRRDGFFVRVPAGKQMYLYVTHTLDRAQAKIGSLRVDARPPRPPVTSDKP